MLENEGTVTVCVELLTGGPLSGIVTATIQSQNGGAIGMYGTHRIIIIMYRFNPVSWYLETL